MAALDGRMDASLASSPTFLESLTKEIVWEVDVACGFGYDFDLRIHYDLRLLFTLEKKKKKYTAFINEV